MKREKIEFEKNFRELFKNKFQGTKYDDIYIDEIFYHLTMKEIVYLKNKLDEGKFKSGEEFNKLFKKIIKRKKEKEEERR